MNKSIICSELTNSYDISLTNGSLSHCCKFDNIKLNNVEMSELKGKYFDLNSETQQARNDLINGIKTKRCNDCWELEAQGKDSWRTTHITNSDTVKLNLQINSLCNQSCFYCSPYLSSSIAKYKQWINDSNAEIFTWNNEKTDQVMNFDYVIEFVADLPSTVTSLMLGLTGGEPFLTENFNSRIQQLMFEFSKKDRNRKIILSISTNTNVDVENLKFFYEIVDKLKETNNVEIQITTSIENIEQRAEYVRGGLVWSNFLENFKIHNTNADQHRIRMTVNPFTVVKIVDFVKFFSAYDVLIDYNYPFQKFYRMDILDSTFESELIQLEDYVHKNSLQHKFLGNWYSKLVLNLCDDKENALRFKQAITNVDKIKNSNWRTVFPEYIEWFDKIK